jgi:hypothetical protein
LHEYVQLRIPGEIVHVFNTIPSEDTFDYTRARSRKKA